MIAHTQENIGDIGTENCKFRATNNYFQKKMAFTLVYQKK